MMKKLLTLLFILTLVSIGYSFPPSGGDCTKDCTFTGTTVTTGALLPKHAQYRINDRVSEYLSYVTDDNDSAVCSLLATWATPSDGGTEVDLCSTQTITYTTGFTTSSSTEQGTGYYLNFDTGDVVTVTHQAALSFTNGSSADTDHVIAFWWYNADDSTQAFINKGNSSAVLEYKVRFNPATDELEWIRYDTGETEDDCIVKTTSTDFVTDTWYHIILSYEHIGTGSQCADGSKIYVNGVNQAVTLTESVNYNYMAQYLDDLVLSNFITGARLSDLLMVKEGHISSPKDAFGLYHKSLYYLNGIQ